MAFEVEILYKLQEMHHPMLDKIMVAATTFGDGGIGWIILGLLFFIFKKTRKCGLLMLISMAVCFIIGNLGIKNIVGRIRPCHIDPSVPLLIPIPGEFSFPSGHTMHAFTAATSILLQHKKGGIAAIALATLVAFSRMYLFVHYPTDILGGLLIGVAVAVLIYKIAGKISRRSL